MRAPQIAFSQLVQDFFVKRLVNERGASARTVESYRDAFELLFTFIEQRTGTPAATLTLADLDAPTVLDFLDYLETGRGNSTRTRNARLAAIHSFMRYAAVRDPASLPITERAGREGGGRKRPLAALPTQPPPSHCQPLTRDRPRRPA